MRADAVVLFEPAIDDHLCLTRRPDPLGIEHPATEGAVETLIATVLPRRSWCDLDWLKPTRRSQSWNGAAENSGP